MALSYITGTRQHPPILIFVKLLRRRIATAALSIHVVSEDETIKPPVLRAAVSKANFTPPKLKLAPGTFVTWERLQQLNDLPGPDKSCFTESYVTAFCMFFCLFV